MVRSAIGKTKPKRGICTADICSMEDDEDRIDGKLNDRHHQSSLDTFFAKLPTIKAKNRLRMATPKATSGSSARISPSPSSKFIGSAKISSSCSVNTGKSRKEQENDPPLTNDPFFSCSEQQADCTAEISTSSSSPSSSSTTFQNQQQQKKRQRTLTQVYIDCGQSSFGQILCQKCGMLYMPGIQEDERQHRQICQAYTLGIPCFQGRITNGKEVERTQDYVILQWKSNSVSTWNRSRSDRGNVTKLHGKVATDVARVRSNIRTRPGHLPTQWPILAQVISKDLGMEELTTLKHLAEQIVFLYIGTAATDAKGSSTKAASYRYSNIGTKTKPTPPFNRILGVVTVQVISQAFRMPSLHDRNLIPEKATLGVGLLWTHSSTRRNGIATRLVTAAREHSIFGVRVPTHLVAFSSPTQAGYAFAQRYCGRSNEVLSCVDGAEGYNGANRDANEHKDSISVKRNEPCTGPLVYEM